MEYDVLKLENQLCFPIYVASREIIQGYNKYFGALDITYPQSLVLMVLWERNHLSVSNIGQRLHLDSGTLTPLLKRMESKGLITRSRSKDDEREVIISLTSKGEILKEETKRISERLEYETPLSEEESVLLKKLMYKFVDGEDNSQNTMRDNRVVEVLGVQYPIVQAPMSWMTDAHLVASVAEAGGLGFLAPHAGQTTNPGSSQEVLDRMRAEIRKVKSLTDKPFGVPFILSYDLSLIPMMVDLLIEEQVPVALDNGLLDKQIYMKLKEAGVKIICRLPNPNLPDALKAQELGADILVLTGFDEGGTLPMKEVGSFSVLAEFVGKVDLPIMIAGGIADRQAVQAAFALGAEGVWIGTAFIATTECRANQRVKEWIVESNANDLLLFRTEPYYYRSLPTQLAKRCFEMSESGASRSEIAKVMNGGTGMRLGMLEGDFDHGYVSVGNGVTSIREICSVKDLIDNLMQGVRGCR